MRKKKVEKENMLITADLPTGDANARSQHTRNFKSACINNTWQIDYVGCAVFSHTHVQFAHLQTTKHVFEPKSFDTNPVLLMPNAQLTEIDTHLIRL